MADILAPYSGPKPPRASLDLNLSHECVYWVGQVVVNWAALMDCVQFQSRMLLSRSSVPASLREERVRHEAKYMIERYRKLGKAAYAGARPNALTYFNSMMGRLGKVKGDRDALVHGDLYHPDYGRKDALSVKYRGRVITYKPNRLAQIAAEMAALNGSLAAFDQWVNYELHFALRQRLERLTPPNKDPDTPNTQ